MSVIPVVKAGARTVLGTVVAHLGLCDLLHRGRVLILAYHRVLPRESLSDYFVEPGMYVTDTTFSDHLTYLKARYDILSMQDWLASWSRGGLNPRGRYCVITFDDGWRDNYTFAFPILRHHRVPATIFLPTAFIATTHWFWIETVTYLLMHGNLGRLAESSLLRSDGKGSIVNPIRALVSEKSGLHDHRHRAERVSLTIQALKHYPLPQIADLCEHLRQELGMTSPRSRICLDWNEIEEMSNHGVSFGSHSSSHQILTRLPLDEAQHEITESKHLLESQRLAFVPVFCYPNGDFNPRIQALVRQADYHAAVTTRDGMETLAPVDRFAIRRVCIHEDVTRTDPLLTVRLVTACTANRFHPVTP